VPVLWCVSTSAHSAHRSQVSFSPTCVHCPTSWMNFSYCCRKTETFLHLPFCASRRRGCVDRSGLCAGPGRLPTLQSGKMKGGGMCFYENSGWCKDVTVILQHCSPDLETFIINCRPFYSPCEFTSFILVCVYIPPQATADTVWSGPTRTP